MASREDAPRTARPDKPIIVSSPGDRYDAPHLAKNAANFTALTPLAFLPRAAAVYPEKIAVIDGAARFTYRDLYARCRRLADALRRRGIGHGETVAVMAPNVPALLEAHFGVPMAGAVLNALNYRLDARSIAFILAHGEAKLLIADCEFAPVVKAALAEFGRPVPLVEIGNASGSPPSLTMRATFRTKSPGFCRPPLVNAKGMPALSRAAGTFVAFWRIRVTRTGVRVPKWPRSRGVAAGDLFHFLFACSN